MELSSLDIVRWFVNILSIIIFIAFLRKFFQLVEKNYGAYMILILNISHLASPIINLATHLLITPRSSEKEVTVFAVTARWIYCFSLFWSASVAIFTYKVLKAETLFRFRQYMTGSLIFCALLALAVCSPIIFEMWNIHVKVNDQGLYIINIFDGSNWDRFKYFFAEILLGNVMPAFLTTYYYFQVYWLLKDDLKTVNTTRRKELQTLWTIAFFAPILCFTPVLICSLLQTFFEMNSSILVLLPSGAKRIWALLNLITFWNLNSSNRRFSSFIGSDSDLTLPLK